MKFMSKTEAFTKLEDEIKIPFDKDQFQFKFTRKWFVHRNLSSWSTFLPKKYKRKGRVKPWNMLQIGVFEAYDLCWCLQQVLQHPDSRVLAIDPWLPNRKIPDMEGVYQRACHNLHPFRKKTHIERGLSQDILPQIIENGITINGRHIQAGEFDLIIVDGDHHAPAVFSDAINSLKLIGKNKWIVFDDFHNRIEKKHHVQEGIEDFIDIRGDAVKLAWQHRFSICLERIK